MYEQRWQNNFVGSLTRRSIPNVRIYERCSIYWHSVNCVKKSCCFAILHTHGQLLCAYIGVTAHTRPCSYRGGSLLHAPTHTVNITQKHGGSRRSRTHRYNCVPAGKLWEKLIVGNWKCTPKYAHWLNIYIHIYTRYIVLPGKKFDNLSPLTLIEVFGVFGCLVSWHTRTHTIHWRYFMTFRGTHTHKSHVRCTYQKEIFGLEDLLICTNCCCCDRNMPEIGQISGHNMGVCPLPIDIRNLYSWLCPNIVFRVFHHSNFVVWLPIFYDIHTHTVLWKYFMEFRCTRTYVILFVKSFFDLGILLTRTNCCCCYRNMRRRNRTNFGP